MEEPGFRDDLLPADLSAGVEFVWNYFPTRAVQPSDGEQPPTRHAVREGSLVEAV